jgi:hypothetical protein
MTEQTEGTERTTEMRRKIRVAVRQEDLEDLKAHGGRYNFFSHTEEDVEDQGFKGWVAQTEEDVEGQGFKYVIAQTEEDVKGQGFKYVIAQTEEDVEGQGMRGGWLEPVGPDDDVEAQGYVWIELEPDEDDTTGQGWRWGAAMTATRPNVVNDLS